MKIEVMIYVYIAVCVSMIVYNTAYIFILHRRQNSLVFDSAKYENIIHEQLFNIESGKGVDPKHIKYLCSKLVRMSQIMAFDKAMESLFEDNSALAEKYITAIFPVFSHITNAYINKDTLKIAYFPYILQKYDVLKLCPDEQLKQTVFKLLRSVNLYCRENALKAVYSMQDADAVAQALSIIDSNLSFHHPKLISDGLLEFDGDTEKLRDTLLSQFGRYSVEMQLNILNYFRFGEIRCDGKMLEILTDERANCELHFCAIRYFEKFPLQEAKKPIQQYAEKLNNLPWEYQAIASTALRAYPDDETFRILVKNLSNSNWYVRLNSATSCEKIGYTYYDLISVFDGNDRYAREIMRYCLENRNTDGSAVNV